jgi:hypothetical protein
MLNINLSDLPVSENNYEPLPAGWYDATVTEATLRDTKSGGKMIALKYTINGPTHQNRIVFGNLNIQNANPEAERIGRQQLGELMRSVGISQLKQPEQLIGRDLCIKLKVRPAAGGYDASNDVNAFKAATNAMPKMMTASSAVAVDDDPFGTQPQIAQKAAAPWVRK